MLRVRVRSSSIELPNPNGICLEYLSEPWGVDDYTPCVTPLHCHGTHHGPGGFTPALVRTIGADTQPVLSASGALARRRGQSLAPRAADAKDSAFAGFQQRREHPQPLTKGACSRRPLYSAQRIREGTGGRAGGRAPLRRGPPDAGASALGVCWPPHPHEPAPVALGVDDVRGRVHRTVPGSMEEPEAAGPSRRPARGFRPRPRLGRSAIAAEQCSVVRRGDRAGPGRARPGRATPRASS
jgi:hypothetical protein